MQTGAVYPLNDERQKDADFLNKENQNIKNNK
jgi:hypothetical protein